MKQEVPPDITLILRPREALFLKARLLSPRSQRSRKQRVTSGASTLTRDNLKGLTIFSQPSVLSPWVMRVRVPAPQEECYIRIMLHANPLRSQSLGDGSVASPTSSSQR